MQVFVEVLSSHLILTKLRWTWQGDCVMVQEIESMLGLGQFT